jgi:hypothetical protein
MTFVTALMFLFGANVFVESIDDLHRLASGKARVLGSLDELGSTQIGVSLRRQVAFDNEVFRQQPKIMAVHRSVRLLLGMTYLFAVAAVATRDLRGRRACLFANWFGLAWSIGNAAFLMLWLRRVLPGILPRFAQVVADDATRLGQPIPDGVVLAKQLLYGAVFSCGLGMVLSLVLLAYFAGRRMRWFYEQSGQAHG